MLAGHNTPGLQLDVISYIRFDLMRTHDETQSEDKKSIRDNLTKEIDSNIPEHAILVAACALLKCVDSVESDETTLTIVIKALSVSAKKEFKLNFFKLNFFKDTTNVDGFNAEQSYWLSAIQIARYLENIDSKSKHRLDLAIMPILALSRLKPNSKCGKTLRLIQSLLVMSILLSQGSVINNNELKVSGEENFIKYLKKLETKLLHTLITKEKNVEREKSMQKFIDNHLKILESSTELKGALIDVKLEKSQVDKLLQEIHTTKSRKGDEMFDAGFTFAILLACQPKPDFGWRFDGLDNKTVNCEFQLEHIAPQTPQIQSSNITLINRLGNFCLLESAINSSAKNKPLSGKKDAYSTSDFFVPRDFSLRLDNSFGDQQISARHKKMLDFLHLRFMESQDITDNPNPSTDLYLILSTESDASLENHHMDKHDTDKDDTDKEDTDKHNMDKLRKLLDDDDKRFIVREYFNDGLLQVPTIAKELHLKAVFYVYNTINPDPKYDGKKIKFKSMKKNRNADEDEDVELIDNKLWDKWRGETTKRWYEKYYEMLRSKISAVDEIVSGSALTLPVPITKSTGKRKRSDASGRDALDKDAAVSDVSGAVTAVHVPVNANVADHVDAVHVPVNANVADQVDANAAPDGLVDGVDDPDRVGLGVEEPDQDDVGLAEPDRDGKRAKKKAEFSKATVTEMKSKKPQKPQFECPDCKKGITKNNNGLFHPHNPCNPKKKTAKQQTSKQQTS
jgi:hypothetical protein